MADHTITIVNSINVFGGAPTNKWGSMVWGVEAWGYGDVDLIQSVFKKISNTFTVSDGVTKSVGKKIAEVLYVDADMSSEHLKDAAGYSYIFPNNTDEGESRIDTQYSNVSYNSATYSDVAATATTWVSV